MWAVNMGRTNITSSAVSVGFWAVVSHTLQSCPSTSLNAAFRCLYYFPHLTEVEKLTSFDWLCNQTLANALFLFSSRWTRLSTNPSSMGSQSPWERMALGVWAKDGPLHSLVTPCKAFANSVSMKSLSPCTMTCLERRVFTFGIQRQSAKFHLAYFSIFIYNRSLANSCHFFGLVNRRMLICGGHQCIWPHLPALSFSPILHWLLWKRAKCASRRSPAMLTP